MKIITILACILCQGFSTIYDFTIQGIDGSAINLNDFRGKKILFVNTATNSPYVSQYAQLDTLSQLFKDSLVVIALPSNSFGHETADDSTIADFVRSTYNIHYLLASKLSVAYSDSSQSPLYKWLTQSSQNGVADNNLNDDFFKFLVDENGNLCGIFEGAVSPLDSSLQKAIIK